MVLAGLVLAGTLLTLHITEQTVEVEEAPLGTINYYHLTPHGSIHEEGIVIDEPLNVARFRNVTRQAYDYSCGSAALTTILDYYLGKNFQERQVMEGLLSYGETEKIIQRRGFSLLDMKRFVGALGYASGGFKAELSDLRELEHPAIAPIEYAGFKHFVVIKAIHKERVFVADPALGNISFAIGRFEEIWQPQVVFIVFPGDTTPLDDLALAEEDMRFIEEYDTIKLTAMDQFKAFTNPVRNKLDTEITTSNPAKTRTETFRYKRN